MAAAKNCFRIVKLASNPITTCGGGRADRDQIQIKVSQCRAKGSPRATGWLMANRSVIGTSCCACGAVYHKHATWD